MGLDQVRDIIVRGYTFLFARFFTVAGLGWLPAAFYGVTSSYLIGLIGRGAAGGPPSEGALNQYSLVYLVTMLIVTAFFGAPMMIPFTREALGMHEEPVAAHFSYGPREWRLFVALLRFYGLVGGAMFVLIVGSGIAITQVQHAGIVLLGIPLSSLLNVVSAIATIAALAFLGVRLGFFLGPIAAVEGHAKITRAWTLSEGNFWGLAAIYLAVTIPVGVFFLIAEYALWGSQLAPSNAGARAIFALQYQHAGSIATMFAIALTTVNALFAAASAAAYAQLDARETETEASAPESSWGIHRAAIQAAQPASHFEETACGPVAVEPAFVQIEPSFAGPVAASRQDTGAFPAIAVPVAEDTKPALAEAYSAAPVADGSTGLAPATDLSAAPPLDPVGMTTATPLRATPPSNSNALHEAAS